MLIHTRLMQVSPQPTAMAVGASALCPATSQHDVSLRSCQDKCISCPLEADAAIDDTACALHRQPHGVHVH